MSCRYCGNAKPNVWVSPDPYYGYGHYPALVCDNCEGYVQDDLGIWHEKSHRYKPRYDDYFMGITTKEPLSLGAGGEWTWCWDCGILMHPWNRCIHLNPCGKICESCATKRYDTDQCYQMYKIEEELKDDPKFQAYQEKCQNLRDWFWEWWGEHKEPNPTDYTKASVFEFIDKLLNIHNPDFPSDLVREITTYWNTTIQM
jgi:hypothetical protein